MKRLLSFSLAVFIGLCLLVATERQAWGYVDPGTGLLALQSAASALAAAGFFLRRKIRNFFRRSTAENEKKAAARVPMGEGKSAKLA